MNRRELGRSSFWTILLLLLIPALAPRARATAIPDNVKQADDVTNNQASIVQAVKISVADLAAGKEGARQELINNAILPGQFGGGGPTVSPAYLDIYDAALNSELLNLAKNPDVTVRLNAAIVAAQVAEVSSNSRLADSVLAFVQDKADPVVLWGIRGARWIIPNLLRGPFKNPRHPLILAVVGAAKKHDQGVAAGWIATDAYDALALDLFDPNRGGQVTADMISGTIEPVQKLLAERLDQYKVEVPADTGADRTGASYLADPRVWGAQDAQQQVHTIQLLSNLLSLAAQQANAQSKHHNTFDVAELLMTVQLTAKAISVVADASGEQGIVQAVTPVTVVSKVTPPAQALKLVQAVYPAIKASTKFSAVTAPPKIQATKAAPPPASAPSQLPPGMTAPLPPPPPPPSSPPSDTRTPARTRAPATPRRGPIRRGQ